MVAKIFEFREEGSKRLGRFLGRCHVNEKYVYEERNKRDKAVSIPRGHQNCITSHLSPFFSRAIDDRRDQKSYSYRGKIHFVQSIWQWFIGENEKRKREGKHRCNGRNVEEIDTWRKRTEEEKYHFGTDRSSPLFFCSPRFSSSSFLDIEANYTNCRIIGNRIIDGDYPILGAIIYAIVSLFILLSNVFQR